MDTLHTRFHAVAQRTTHHPAIVQSDYTLSYGQLMDTVAVLSRRLAGAGVRRGTGVALVLTNSAEFVSAFFAARF